MLNRLKDTDVPKLEFDKTSKATAFENWLQRAALRIGGLHQKLESFWMAAQLATATAYDRYLSLGPIDRPMVRVDSSWITAEQCCIEMRLRPIILEAVPEVVRKSALSTRQTGVADLLFAAMIEAGPGTLKDRESTLEAVNHPAQTPVAGVYEQLQRWKFDLTRLMRLGMAPPDPTMQANTLKRMVAKMAEQDTAFQYRLHAFQMQHGMFGLLTQGQVDEFWRYLSAEAREAQGQEGGKAAAKAARKQAAKEAAAAAAGVQPGAGQDGNKGGKGGGKGGDKGKGKGAANASPPGQGAGQMKPCDYFLTKRGCNRGGQCPFFHKRLLATDGRCFNCGSTEHGMKECTRPRREAAPKASEATPQKAPAAAQQQQQAQQQQPPQQPAQVDKGADIGKVVAATIAALAGDGLPRAAPASYQERRDVVTPSWQQQQQQRQGQAPSQSEEHWLDAWVQPRAAPAVAGPAAKAERKVVRTRGAMLLVDSGATHEVRSVCMETELPADCQPVQLLLAAGETEAWMSGEDIVYVVTSGHEEELQPLFPIGAYIQDCDLKLGWSRDVCVLRSPAGECFEMEQHGSSAYISEESMDRLRELRKETRAGRVAAMLQRARQTVTTVAELQRHKVAGHPTFLASCEECRLAAGRMRQHFRMDAATRPGGECSVDLAGPFPPGTWPGAEPGDEARRASFFLLVAYQVLTPEEVATRKANMEEACAAAGVEEAEAAHMAQVDLEFQSEGLNVLYYTTPLESKASADVIPAMQAVVNEICKLFGAPVVYRIHGDRAGELTGPAARA